MFILYMRTRNCHFSIFLFSILCLHLNFLFYFIIRQLAECKENYNAATTIKLSKEKEMSACNSEIKSLNLQKTKLDKQYENACLEIRKIESKLLQWEKNGKDAKKNLDDLVKEHSWIESEKGYFGKKDSDFDFDVRSVEESKKRVAELTAAQVERNLIIISYFHYYYLLYLLVIIFAIFFL